jgi:hypothetical protein
LRSNNFDTLHDYNCDVNKERDDVSNSIVKKKIPNDDKVGGTCVETQSSEDSNNSSSCSCSGSSIDGNEGFDEDGGDKVSNTKGEAVVSRNNETSNKEDWRWSIDKKNSEQKNDDYNNKGKVIPNNEIEEDSETSSTITDDDDDDDDDKLINETGNGTVNCEMCKIKNIQIKKLNKIIKRERKTKRKSRE